MTFENDNSDHELPNTVGEYSIFLAVSFVGMAIVVLATWKLVDFLRPWFCEL